MLKIAKFTDVCMTGGMMHVLPDTDTSSLYFQPKFEIRQYFLQVNVRLL